MKVYADFLLYADYLQSALKLIKIRRKKLNYFGKRKEIENNLLSKIADLYRICSERFKVISSSNITYNLMVWLAGMVRNYCSGILSAQGNLSTNGLPPFRIYF